jgi:uncharacterized protein YjbJ (UPF0337 family)
MSELHEGERASRRSAHEPDEDVVATAAARLLVAMGRRAQADGHKYDVARSSVVPGKRSVAPHVRSQDASCRRVCVWQRAPGFAASGFLRVAAGHKSVSTRLNQSGGTVMGLKDEAEGKAKEVQGKLTGNQKRETEGKLQQAKGKTKDVAKDVRDAAKKSR